MGLGVGLSLLEHRLAGERRLAVDFHPAGAADRRAAGAADGERTVVAVLRLQEPVEHRQRGVELDVEGLPVRTLDLLGLEAPNLQCEFSHLSSPYPSSTSAPAAPTA